MGAAFERTPRMKERPSFPAKLDTGSKSTKPKTAPTNTATGFGLDSSTVRARMVQKLAQQGIEDTGVLDAMGFIERHRFVDSALANQAYEDTSLPIGLGQTISKPNVVARMIALLREAPGVQGQIMGRILEMARGAVTKQRCYLWWRVRSTALSACVDCTTRQEKT